MPDKNAHFHAPTTDEWIERIAADDPGADLERLLRFDSPEGWSVRAFYGRTQVMPGSSPSVRPAGTAWEIRVATAGGFVPPAEPDTVRVFAVGPERQAGPLLASLGPGPVRLVATDADSALAALDLADARVRSVEYDPTRDGSSDTAAFLVVRTEASLAVDGTPGAPFGPATAIACALLSLDRWFDAGRRCCPDATGVARRLLVRMPVFEGFFPTLAGLRAAREAVDRLAGAWGTAADVRIPLHAIAGPFAPAGGDDGLVRATLALAACAAGGCDAIELIPPDTDTDRVVRHLTNLHRLLLHEGHMQDADDPSAGSWYLERFTDTLGSMAWDAFRRVRDLPGATPGDVAAAVRAVAGGSSHA